MPEDLANLAAFIHDLPAGTVVDEALKLDLLGRIAKIGQGEPQAAGGSRYGALRAELTGPGGKYPAPKGDDR